MMKTLLLFAFFTISGFAESSLNKNDPHYHIRHHWNWNWKNHYGYKPKEPKFYYGYATPYKLLGDPPYWERRPYGCKPKQLYIILRHGERFPDLRNRWEENLAPLEEILNPLMKSSTGIAPSVKVKFPWKNPFLKKERGRISPAGDKQLYKVGRSFARRFPEFLKGRFSAADFNITASCSPRSGQSASAFSLGYFQGTGRVTKLHLQPMGITTYSCENDKMISAWSPCADYHPSLNPSKIFEAESANLLKTGEFQNIVKKVRRKLGLIGEARLNEELVLTMFRACAWEFEVFGKKRWCSLFSTSDMQFYDLFVDLYSYQRWGPGSQLNLDTSCILLKDLFDNLKGMSKGKPDILNVIIRVGHGGTITNAVGRLGLFVSKVPMKAKYYKTLLKKREFTYGKVLPMSGSFAFVLYKCHHGGHKVQLYVNERLVKLPPCHSKFDCTLKSLLDKYEKDFNSCALNYDNVCKPKKHKYYYYK